MNTNFNNKTVLITGGAGFIGSNIAFYLQEHYPDCNIIIFDIFRNNTALEHGNALHLGHYKNLRGFKGEIICGNIANQKDLININRYKLDYIFHQAAISNTRIFNQEIILRNNVNSFYALLEIAKMHNAKIVYASSAATYGSSPPPQNIGNEFPENPYGFSKYAMDQIALQYIKTNKHMHIIGLRYFNVYGAKEFFKGTTASMILQLGHQILSGKPPRLFTGSKSIKRDFVYIKDVISANLAACTATASGIYNIGSGTSRSFFDISNILQKELHTNLDVDYFKNPFDSYQMHTHANISLSKKRLSYYPKYTLEQGIQDYLPYIHQTFNWIEK